MGPANRVFLDLEHAPRDPEAFWRFATALCVRHAPRDASDYAEYEASLSIVLRIAYFREFDAFEDGSTGGLVSQCIQTARHFTRNLVDR